MDPKIRYIPLSLCKHALFGYDCYTYCIRSIFPPVICSSKLVFLLGEIVDPGLNAHRVDWRGQTQQTLSGAKARLEGSMLEGSTSDVVKGVTYIQVRYRSTQ